MASTNIFKDGWLVLNITLKADHHFTRWCVSASNVAQESLFTKPHRNGESMRSLLFCLTADLLERLERLRGSEKTVGEVGTTLLSWVSEKTERDG